MKKLSFIALISLVIAFGCKEHAQPIKWEKPGDELVGEWVWSKGTTYYPDHTVVETELGAFTGNPTLKMVTTAVFKSDGTSEMINETPRSTHTRKGKWSVNKDTLKITFSDNGHVTLSQYKVKGEILFVDHLATPKKIEEFTRD